MMRKFVIITAIPGLQYILAHTLDYRATSVTALLWCVSAISISPPYTQFNFIDQQLQYIQLCKP